MKELWEQLNKSKSMWYKLNDCIERLEKINQKQQVRFIAIPFTTVIWYAFGITLTNKQLTRFDKIIGLVDNVDCDVYLYGQIVAEIIYKNY